MKAHGARRLIEGDFEEGDRVVVVDDILITGGSVLEGTPSWRARGLQVQDVVVFIDHGGDHDRQARERLAAAGYRCHAVSTSGALPRCCCGRAAQRCPGRGAAAERSCRLGHQQPHGGLGLHPHPLTSFSEPFLRAGRCSPWW